MFMPNRYLEVGRVRFQSCLDVWMKPGNRKLHLLSTHPLGEFLSGFSYNFGRDNIPQSWRCFRSVEN